MRTHTLSGVGDVCCFNGISLFVMKLNNENKKYTKLKKNGRTLPPAEQCQNYIKLKSY